MAQQDYGPAQPIADVVKKGYDTVRKYLGDPEKPAPAAKSDTSWADEQVRKANESFRKAASSDPKLGGTKKSSPKKSQRKTAAKR